MTTREELVRRLQHHLDCWTSPGVTSDAMELIREAAAMLAAGPTEEEVGTAAAVASIEAYGEHAQKLARAVLRWKDGK